MGFPAIFPVNQSNHSRSVDQPQHSPLCALADQTQSSSGPQTLKGHFFSMEECCSGFHSKSPTEKKDYMPILAYLHFSLLNPQFHPIFWDTKSSVLPENITLLLKISQVAVSKTLVGS